MHTTSLFRGTARPDFQCQIGPRPHLHRILSIADRLRLTWDTRPS